MKTLCIAFVIIFTSAFSVFFVKESSKVKTKAISNRKIVAEINYIEKINQDKLGLAAIKEIFTQASHNQSPVSRSQLKKRYILTQLQNKKAIEPEALDFINSLPDQKSQQYKLGLIYQDMGLIEKAKECWVKHPSIESTIALAKSHIADFQYETALDILTDYNFSENNFEIMNLIYSIQLILGDKRQAMSSKKLIDNHYGEMLEWKLKKATMHFMVASYTEACEDLEGMIFSRKLDVNHLACAYNARMYLFLARLLKSSPGQFYVDDIIMAAEQDCKAIFNISGKSQYFQLFVDQKTIEKELAFYRSFIMLLQGKVSPNGFRSKSSHIVSRYLTSRLYSQTKQKKMAAQIIKSWERGRQIDLISGIHYGFINSPIYLINNAEILTSEGKFANSNKLLDYLHRNSITYESAKLHNFNQRMTGNEIYFDKKSLVILQSKKEIEDSLRPSTFHNELKDKGQHALINLLKIAKNDKSASIEGLEKLYQSGNKQALIELALIKYEDKEIDASIRLFNKASKYSETSRSASLFLARIYAQKNQLNKIEEVLQKLIKLRDPEALLISASVAHQVHHYPKAFLYSQLFVEAHGNTLEVLIIKANSAHKMYISLPSKSNRILLEQVAQQIQGIDSVKNFTLEELYCKILIELGELTKAYERAKESENHKLTKKIKVIRLKEKLKQLPFDQWTSFIKNHQSNMSKLELEDLLVSAMIEKEKYFDAEAILQHRSDLKSKHYQLIIHHLTKNEDKREEIISELGASDKLWCMLAQVSYRQKDFNLAAECFKKALLHNPKSILISNNYINCMLKTKGDLSSKIISKAYDNYNKLPQKETLNTLVEVLCKFKEIDRIQKLLEAQRSLSLEHEIMLAEIYQNNAPKKAQALIVRVLSTQGNMLDSSKKNELKQWLEVCTIAP